MHNDTAPTANEICAFTPEQVARIFTEKGDFIFATIIYLLRSDQEAEDIFQDFFLSLLTKRHHRAIIYSKKYLRQALANDVNDFARRRKRHQQHLRRLARYHLQHRIKNRPVELAAIPDEYAAVINVIKEHLPESFASVLKLRYQKEYTYAQIAARLQIDRKTARKYSSLGKARIRAELEKRRSPANNGCIET